MPPTHLAPGIWRITVPLPFRPRTVNAYLLDGGGGEYALIDGGADTPDAWAALDADVEYVLRTWDAVSLQVVTHMHVDHFGLAGHVRVASRAPLAMGRLDAERAAHAASDPADEALYRERMLREAGAPEDLVARMSAPTPAAGFVGCDHPLAEPVSAVPFLVDWQAVWTPGHTAGHISLFRASDGVLLAGDAVLPRVTPTIGVNRQRPDPVADYLGTIATVEGLRPRLILPGHGHPIVDAAARLAELRHETEAESRRVADLLGAGGATTAEIVAARYPGRDLPDPQIMQAIRETAAHLHHLVATGAASSDREGELVRFWHP